MSNSNDVLIKVENVSKKFCRSLKRSMLYGIEDISRDLLHLPNNSDKLRKDEFWAVDDVSFEVRRGECLGIIGRNGAGKSTLLKMLNGIILPDKGKITIKGKVGALIEVGAGFHPMLTGRENVYVNGSILGMTKREIDNKFDEIVAFAELEEFIDMPVKHYSSGMNVRLGFAIATTINPDILILDEVLAVGDVSFQIKCLNRVRKLASNSAVIFVSHNMQHIALFCSLVFKLVKGEQLLLSEDINLVIADYLSDNQILENCSGTLEARVHRTKIIIDEQAIESAHSIAIKSGECVAFEMVVELFQPLSECYFLCAIMDSQRTALISIPFQVVQSTPFQDFPPPALYCLRFSLGEVHLNSGSYSLMFAVKMKKTHQVLLRHEGLLPFNVISTYADLAGKFIKETELQIDCISGISDQYNIIFNQNRS